MLADNEDVNIDLEHMDTHVVNAVLTGSKSKSSLIESVSCDPAIIPNELNLDSSSSNTLDWVKIPRTDPKLSVILKLIESWQLFKKTLHGKDSPEVNQEEFKIDQRHFVQERLLRQ